MRTAAVLLSVVLTACQAKTPEQQLNRATERQRQIEAIPLDGDPNGNRVSIDDDAATPTQNTH